MSRNAKLSDVARMAGVSTATVSRVFNKPDIVRPDVRQRVIEAAKRLGYTPNPAAKALRSRKSRMVGVVIPTLDHAIYARMVNSAEATLVGAGYMILVVSVGFDNSRVYERIRLLVERGAEALIVVGAIEDADARRFLAEKRIPAVTTYSFQGEGELPSIGFDNHAATAKVLEYLTGLGHRAVAMVVGPTTGNDRQQARIRAYREGMAAIGRPGLLIEKAYSMANGIEAMRTIAAQAPETTAVMCSSDVFAFSAISECRRMGLRVPDHLSITGFDDLDFASELDPPLTTVAVPAAEMGQRCADALLHALEHGRPIIPLLLDTTLVVRSSTARPR